jgi:virulence factor
VDALRYLAGDSGETMQLHAIADRNGDVVDNAWNAVMKFANGVTGVLLTNWNVGGRMHCMEIHSPGISAFIDPDTGIRILRENKVETYEAAEICKGDQEYMKSGFYYENLHFIECVKEKRTPRSSFQDAVHTMELVERIRG